jgi:hypothetical protein
MILIIIIYAVAATTGLEAQRAVTATTAASHDVNNTTSGDASQLVRWLRQQKQEKLIAAMRRERLIFAHAPVMCLLHKTFEYVGGFAILRNGKFHSYCNRRFPRIIAHFFSFFSSNML